MPKRQFVVVIDVPDVLPKERRSDGSWNPNFFRWLAANAPETHATVSRVGREAAAKRRAERRRATR